MINNERIGIGIVTCSRKNIFQKLHKSLIQCEDIIDRLVVFEDVKGERPFGDGGYAEDMLFNWNGSHRCVLANENKGVGKAKNYCLRDLLIDGCDHIFLIEDDICIRDSSVFEKYIEASKVSGIQHFNYSQHGVMNKTYGCGVDTPMPNPRFIMDYGPLRIPLYPHCVGAFSYYSRKCLEDVGLLDERYYNACEHVDHTYEVIKAGMHPPFWYFADIDHSDFYLEDDPWSIEKSTISSNPRHKEMMIDADKIFVTKHGLLPAQIPLTSEKEVINSLKQIKKNHEK